MGPAVAKLIVAGNSQLVAGDAGRTSRARPVSLKLPKARRTHKATTTPSRMSYGHRSSCEKKGSYPGGAALHPVTTHSGDLFVPHHSCPPQWRAWCLAISRAPVRHRQKASLSGPDVHEALRSSDRAVDGGSLTSRCWIDARYPSSSLLQREASLTPPPRARMTRDVLLLHVLANSLHARRIVAPAGHHRQ